MKNLILASLFVLGAVVACTPKEGATTPEATPTEPTPTEPAANNATTPDPAPEADGKGAPAEADGK